MTFRFLCLALVLLLCTTASGQTMTLCTPLLGGNSNAGNMFDITTTNPVIISGFDQCFASTGVSATVEVYVVTGGGTFVGNETNAAAWTMIATAVVPVTSGVGIADPVPFATSLNVNIPAGGTQGFYITTTGSPSNSYTNGTAVGNPLSSDANITVHEGVGKTYPFSTTNTTRNWNGCVKYQLAQQFPIDLSISNISSPIDSDPNSCMGTLSNAEQITCDVFNIGFNAIPAGTMIPLNWQVDGGAQSGSDMLTLAAPLMPLTSIQHTFSTTVDMSTPATYSLDVAVALGGDGDPGNDLKNKMVTSLPPAPGGGTLPFHEDFETFGATINGNVVPLGWINDANDGTADWLFENSAPSGSTTNGPVADHTTGVAGAGIFAYTEDSLSVNDTINLLTPCLSLAGTTNPLASFWISSATLTNPAQQNPVAIDVEASGGGLTMDVVPATAQLGTGNQWVQYQVELTAFIGQTVRLQFRGRDNNQGVSTTINDVGLDDIAVVDFVEGTGQRPQFGLAALDINSSLEANGFPIDLGLGGPYLVSVNTGSSADFTMTGVPNQPFLLIAGTLSVNAANFGLVGQLDLNNPGLELIGDGTGGGFLNSFFIFDGTGERKLSFGISPLFAGLMKSFQCINLTGTPLVIAFSNAVQASFL